jgi:hypothetical protein
MNRTACFMSMHAAREPTTGGSGTRRRAEARENRIELQSGSEARRDDGRHASSSVLVLKDLVDPLRQTDGLQTTAWGGPGPTWLWGAASPSGSTFADCAGTRAPAGVERAISFRGRRRRTPSASGTSSACARRRARRPGHSATTRTRGTPSSASARPRLACAVRYGSKAELHRSLFGSRRHRIRTSFRRLPPQASPMCENRRSACSFGVNSYHEQSSGKDGM